MPKSLELQGVNISGDPRDHRGVNISGVPVIRGGAFPGIKVVGYIPGVPADRQQPEICKHPRRPWDHQRVHLVPCERDHSNVSIPGIPGRTTGMG